MSRNANTAPTRNIKIMLRERRQFFRHLCKPALDLHRGLESFVGVILLDFASPQCSQTQPWNSAAMRFTDPSPISTSPVRRFFIFPSVYLYCIGRRPAAKGLRPIQFKEFYGNLAV